MAEKIRETKEQFIARRTRGTCCTCGGPAYGTDHAPDCDWAVAREMAEDDWKDEVYQRRVADIDAALDRGELAPEEYADALFAASRR